MENVQRDNTTINLYNRSQGPLLKARLTADFCLNNCSFVTMVDAEFTDISCCSAKARFTNCSVCLCTFTAKKC